MGSNIYFPCVKYATITINVVISFVAIALVILASIARFETRGEDSIRNLLDRYRNGVEIETIYILLYALWSVGSLTALVGVLGVIGACRKNFRILISFAIFLGILILAEGACVVAAYICKDQVKYALQCSLVKEIETLFTLTGADYEKAHALLGQMQVEMKCCGCFDVTDYERASAKYPNGTVLFPKGCDMHEYHTNGCCPFWDQLVSNTKLVGYASLGFLAVELHAFVLALTMAALIRRASAASVEALEGDGGEDQSDGCGPKIQKDRRSEPKLSTKPLIPGHEPKTQTHSLFSKKDGPILAYTPEASTHL